MVGILLAITASGLLEVSDSLGKNQMLFARQKIAETGMLGVLASIAYFTVLVVVRQSWQFSFEIFPIFALRFVLEIILAEIAIRALARADRSTYGLLRVLTIPLLLVVDIFIGKNIAPVQILGIIVIVLAMTQLFHNGGIQHDHAFIVLTTAVFAVVTISLYQYDITHGNGIETEQIIIWSGQLIYFRLKSWREGGRGILTLIRERRALLQSLSSGAAGVIQSFAYLFAPASIVITAARSASVLASIASGRMYFAEKHLKRKLVAALVIVGGLILLAQGR